MGYKSPQNIAVFIGHNIINFVDSTTYYFSNHPRSPSTTVNIHALYPPVPLKIKRCIYVENSLNITGSNEAWSFYIRKNNTTDYLIATVSSNVNPRVFKNDDLNIDLLQTDYIEIKTVCPAWVTNPDSSSGGGFLFCEFM